MPCRTLKGLIHIGAPPTTQVSTLFHQLTRERPRFGLEGGGKCQSRVASAEVSQLDWILCFFIFTPKKTCFDFMLYSFRTLFECCIRGQLDYVLWEVTRTARYYKSILLRLALCYAWSSCFGRFLRMLQTYFLGVRNNFEIDGMLDYDAWQRFRECQSGVRGVGGYAVSTKFAVTFLKTRRRSVAVLVLALFPPWVIMSSICKRYLPLVVVWLCVLVYNTKHHLLQLKITIPAPIFGRLTN